MWLPSLHAFPPTTLLSMHRELGEITMILWATYDVKTDCVQVQCRRQGYDNGVHTTQEAFSFSLFFHLILKIIPMLAFPYLPHLYFSIFTNYGIKQVDEEKDWGMPVLWGEVCGIELMQCKPVYTSFVPSVTLSNAFVVLQHSWKMLSPSGLGINSLASATLH
jgi:hypothetical protein